MKTSILVGCSSAALCVTACTLSNSSPVHAKGDLSAEDFRAEYSQAKTDLAKRDVILRGIDDGLIAVGMSWYDLQELFAEPIVVSPVDFPGERICTIFNPRYEPSSKEPDGIPDCDIGWSIHFTVSRYDRIEYYHLKCMSGKGGRRLTSDGRLSNQECKRFRDTYLAATVESARRSAVMSAMDEAKLIYYGMALSELKCLFGDDLRVELDDMTDTLIGFVLFDPPVLDASYDLPDAAQLRTYPPGSGWYIDFLMTKGGYVEKYRLSNVHRGKSKDRVAEGGFPPPAPTDPDVRD